MLSDGKFDQTSALSFHKVLYPLFQKNTIFAARKTFCADVNTVFTFKEKGKAYD
jgi:hypothetical protein